MAGEGNNVQVATTYDQEVAGERPGEIDDAWMNQGGLPDGMADIRRVAAARFAKTYDTAPERGHVDEEWMAAGGLE